MADKKDSRKNRDSQLQAASDVLHSLLGNSKSPLSDQFLRWRVWHRWPEIVGETVAAHCEPVGFQRGTLLVWVENSAWLQQLSFFNKMMVEKVNAHLGKNWIRQVRLTLDRRNVEMVGQEMSRFLDRE